MHEATNVTTDDNYDTEMENNMEISDDVIVRTWEYIMTQRNLNKSLKLYGNQ